jgi:hypothetical protein
LGSGSGSAIRKNAGSGSALNQCGSTTLPRPPGHRLRQGHRPEAGGSRGGQCGERGEEAAGGGDRGGADSSGQAGAQGTDRQISSRLFWNCRYVISNVAVGDVHPGSKFFFISDSGSVFFFHPGSASKNLSILTLKKFSNLSDDPGSSSRIRIQGSKRHRIRISGFESRHPSKITNVRHKQGVANTP